jgi:hypothetical protein
MGAIALHFEIWDQYDGGLVIVGLVLQAVIFNCLMLPVSLTATWKWWRCQQRPAAQPPHPRGGRLDDSSSRTP